MKFATLKSVLIVTFLAAMSLTMTGCVEDAEVLLFGEPAAKKRAALVEDF